jgi:hypothetical protein
VRRATPARAAHARAPRRAARARARPRATAGLPVHVVVAGERNASAEARLLRLGADAITESPAVAPPRWTSTFHRLSFGRLAALALTQFERVVVLDNDVTLLRPIDELAAAEAPAMVFHTATVLPRKERCALRSDPRRDPTRPDATRRDLTRPDPTRPDPTRPDPEW